MKIQFLLDIDGKKYRLRNDGVQLTIHDEETTILSVVEGRDEIDFDIVDYESVARAWCKYDSTRKCVDCEGCPDKESEVAK